MALSQNLRHLPVYEPLRGFTSSSFPLQGGNVYSRSFDVVIAGVTAVHSAVEHSPVESLTVSVDALRNAIEDLRGEIASLKEQLEAVVALVVPRPREISDDHARQEIKDYFESLHGEVIYPSEIADNLNIDYEQVIRLMQDLVDNGEIAAT